MYINILLSIYLYLPSKVTSVARDWTENREDGKELTHDINLKLFVMELHSIQQKYGNIIDYFGIVVLLWEL